MGFRIIYNIYMQYKYKWRYSMWAITYSVGFPFLTPTHFLPHLVDAELRQEAFRFQTKDHEAPRCRDFRVGCSGIKQNPSGYIEM